MLPDLKREGPLSNQRAFFVHVKCSYAALCFVFPHCDLRKSRSHSSRLARLASEAFYENDEFLFSGSSLQRTKKVRLIPRDLCASPLDYFKTTFLKSIRILPLRSTLDIKIAK